MDSQGQQIMATTASGRRIPYATLQCDLKGMTSPIHCIAVAPNSLYVAAGARNGEVRIWNTRNDPGFLLNPHDASRLPSSIAFSSNSECLAASMVQVVYIWAVNTGQQKFQLAHPDVVTSIAFSPSGEHIACADRDIHIWNMDTKQRVNVLKGNGTNVLGLSYFPDRAQVASSSYDGSLRIWKVERQRLLPEMHTQNGHGGKPINCSALSPDGKTLASGGDDAQVILWDVKTLNRLERPYQGHIMNVTSVSFSPDGKYVASSSSIGHERGNIHILDAKSGCLVAELDNRNSGNSCVLYTPDGKSILTLAPWDNRLIRILRLKQPVPPPHLAQQTESGGSGPHSLLSTAATSAIDELDYPVQDTDPNTCLCQSQHAALQLQLDDLRNQVSLLTASLTSLQDW